MKIYFDALSRIPTVSIGTQAYIISGLQILEKRYPGSEYFFLSSNPVIDEYFLKGLPQKITLIKRSDSQLATILQVRKIVNSVDAVVSSWGDAYISSPPYQILRKALFLKKKGVPLVLFTSSIGPFQGGIKKFLAKIGLNRFDYISVRDSITYEFLKSIDLKKVELIHDTAFVLEPAKDADIDSILINSNIPFNIPFLGLNISILLFHVYKKLNRNYVQEMVEIIKWMRETYDVPIVLMPHQLFPSCYKYTEEEFRSMDGDDRYAIELIWQELKKRDGIFKLNGQYSPIELKGILKRCVIFVGGRMHSVIGAISQYVPSLILQYSHKAGGMMKFLNLSEYVWDIKSDNKELKTKIDLLWRNKETIKNKLKKEMPSIFSKINSLTDEIERLIRK